MIELIDGTLRQITDLLGKLYGLPGYVSVFLFCLGFGYALKRSRWFPNDAIPLLVICWGSIWTCLIADPKADQLPLRVWVVKNIVFGALVGCAAWAVHANRRRIPVLGKFFPEGDTAFIKKPGVSETIPGTKDPANPTETRTHERWSPPPTRDRF